MSNRTVDAGAFPKVVLLDTTNMCNLRCSMCGHRTMLRKQGKMSMALYRKIIDEIADADKNTRVWMTFFGESLLLRHQLFWQILYAKRKGLSDVVINTNGTLLDEEASRCIIESGLDGIYIGIDAHDPTTYSKIRIGGDYQKTVANVSRLLELRHEMKSPSPQVVVQFVEMEENTAEVDDFTRYWTKQGAIVKIRPKVTWAGTVAPYKMNLATNINRYPCYWLMRTMNICWNGDVVLCSVDFDARFVAGNVKNKSLKSVWNGSLKALRDYQAEYKFDQMPVFCAECTDWQMARADYYE